MKTFKKYGLNNVHIWSTVWVSNSGKVEYSFLVAKISKTLLFSGNVCSDLIRISGCLLMIILNLNDIAM